MAAKFGEARDQLKAPISGSIGVDPSLKLWRKPPDRTIKINSDGAWSGPSHAGLGVVIRDPMVGGSEEQLLGDRAPMLN